MDNIDDSEVDQSVSIKTVAKYHPTDTGETDDASRFHNVP